MTTETTNSPYIQSARPVIAKTDKDRQCLILKGVRFSNGKRYDIRIWKMDGDGIQIPLKEKMQFSDSALKDIQEVAKAVFNEFNDPAKSKILYREDPELCEAHNQDGSSVNLIKQMTEWKDEGAAKIVAGARTIHGLLFPKSEIETARNPAERLIVEPEVESDPIVTVPRTETSLPPIEETTPATTNISTPIESTTTPVPVASNPSLDQITKKALEEASKTAETFNNDSSFLKGITFADFQSYALQKIKKPEDPLFHAYEIYKQVVQDPTHPHFPDEERGQMKGWLQWHFLNAYKTRKDLEPFKEFYLEKHSPFNEVEFDDWCKLHAANDVIGFTRVERMNVNPLIKELKLILGQNLDLNW